MYRKEYAALFSFHRLQLRHRCYFATRTLAGTQEIWLKKKFISLVEALYTGMQANVAMSVSVSEDFSVNNRVKQGKKIGGMLVQMNLRWLGHVERMDCQRLPRQLLYSHLREGKRNQGRPRIRFKDTEKETWRSWT